MPSSNDTEKLRYADTYASFQSRIAYDETLL